jgi:hypothetical protein
VQAVDQPIDVLFNGFKPDGEHSVAGSFLCFRRFDLARTECSRAVMKPSTAVERLGAASRPGQAL